MPDSPPDIALSKERAATIRRGLLQWYRAGHRSMPWRAEAPDQPNPYYVLVSEAMLQQTQVATVIDYFRRFIEAFPTINALAEADEQRVLTLWQGLGYYRRARNLHAAAKLIVQAHDGQVPQRVEDLLKLPGVGRYTAGAIASIAYDTPAPIVDGNVERVMARLLAIRQPINTPAVKQCIWSLAEQLVPQKHAGDFNQSVMELGATVCTPKQPKCPACPLAEQCEASASGQAESLPVKLPRKKPKQVTHTILAAHRGHQFLFEQRPTKGLWSNMWQLPTFEQSTQTRSGGKQLLRPTDSHLLPTFQDRFGIALSHPINIANFKHQTTHRSIQFQIWLAEVESGRTRRGTGQWRRLDCLADLPLPNPQQIAIQHIKAHQSQP